MTRRLLTVAVALVALLLVPSAALAKRGDRNHDRIPDKWERHFHLSLKQNQAKRDPDHDGLNNQQEFKDHTNPRKGDTDADGVDDGDEVANGDDPTDPDSGGADDASRKSGDASAPRHALLVTLIGLPSVFRLAVSKSCDVCCARIRAQADTLL